MSDNNSVKQNKEHGTIQVPAFDLPPSYFLSPASRREQGMYPESRESAADRPADLSPSSMAQFRRQVAEQFYATPFYQALRERYPVEIDTVEINGVTVEIFTPLNAIADSHQKKVLINLHAGSFEFGSRTNSHAESIPIAALAQTQVVSVDYRMAPEYQFPAASDDVLAVYQGLLENYSPDDIGLYGCSAGATLAAQTIARLLKEQLPLPAAIGMLSGAASRWTGDSMYIVEKLYGAELVQAQLDHPYLCNADLDDPLVTPAASDEVMAQFPPSLLLASVRDFALSSVAHTHSRLVQLGVDTDLHIWEGMGHAFMLIPDYEESQQAYQVIVRFFEKHLGGRG